MFENTPGEIVEKRLILLYIFNKLDEPVSNNQITKIVLENSIMDYFTLQKHFSELVKTGLISSFENENTTLYLMSKDGKKMLDYFSDNIPSGIKNIIESNIKKIKNQLKAETSISADFTPESETEYIVNCRIAEGSSVLLDLKITVGTRQDAHTICSNWKSNAQDIYLYLIQKLSQKE